MARIRTIKPAFFMNEDMSEASRDARLLAIALLCMADREGRLADRPKRIKLEAFPWDEVNVDDLLGELAQVGYILRYEAEGERWIQVVNFTKHQRPHMKEAQSTIPAPPSEGNEPPPSGPAPIRAVASTYLGSGQHAQEWDPEKGNGIQEGEGGHAHSREETQPPASESSSLSSPARMNRRLTTAGPGEGWSFSEEDLAVLSEAGETIGVPARDLPRRILNYLAKQDGPAFDRWHAMEPSTVAAWCREGVRLAVKAKGAHEGPALVAYIGSIVGTRLEAKKDLLEQKVVPIGRGDQGSRAASSREATQGWLQRRRGVAT